MYVFSSEGTYEYNGVARISTGRCTSMIYGYYTGTVTVEGNVLTIYQNDGTTRHEDSCGTTSESRANPDTRVFNWHIGFDEYGKETLTLIDTDGGVSPFRRWEE